MSQKRTPKIDRFGEQPSERRNPPDYYGFIFSDKIEDWCGSRKLKIHAAKYEREKERNIIKKLKTISKQKQSGMDAGTQGHELEKKCKAKHPKHKPNTKGRAANLNP